jgi:GNAT superfamily N-acetyltransferase
VARAGAELIASSDRAYFGDTVRHDHVIPLFVENPTEHEVVDEGKGLTVHGRTLDSAAIALTRREVYRRRLLDGAMAIERYDITKESDVQRALAVLQELVPAGSGPGHLVYVWVGGPLIEGTERVADVHDRIPAFLAALDQAPIERSRVVVFARPVFQAKGKGRKDLRAAADRARDQGVLYGVNMISAALRSMMGWGTAPAPTSLRPSSSVSGGRSRRTRPSGSKCPASRANGGRSKYLQMRSRRGPSRPPTA